MPLRRPRKRRPEAAGEDTRERRLARRVEARSRRRESPRERETTRSAPVRSGAPQATGRVGRAALAGAGEIVAIGREMVRIPASLWMRLAERAGALTLAAWRVVWPLLVAGWGAVRALLRVAERQVTPARATAAVLAVAIGVLVASQFIDYREVRAGVPDYAGVENVAPAPVIPGSADTTGSAHAYVVLLIAAAALVLLVMAMRGRWRMARLLAPLGLAVVAIALVIDAPKGLDEGVTAIQFEGAEAELLSGFWTQLVAGGVIAVIGPVLALNLSRDRRSAKARRARRPRGARRRALASRLGRSRVEGAGT
jgi:uncharacterized membrane protein